MDNVFFTQKNSKSLNGTRVGQNMSLQTFPYGSGQDVLFFLVANICIKYVPSFFNFFTILKRLRSVLYKNYLANFCISVSWTICFFNEELRRLIFRTQKGWSAIENSQMVLILSRFKKLTVSKVYPDLSG